MSNKQFVVRVTLEVTLDSNGARVEYFRASQEDERFDASANANGDLTVARWSINDPYGFRHTVAILAAGKWVRVDQGWMDETS